MMLLAVMVGLDFVAVSIWMMFLFMLEKLHGPLDHQECSHDAATSGRVKSLFASRFQGIIPTYIQMWSSILYILGLDGLTCANRASVTDLFHDL